MRVYSGSFNDGRSAARLGVSVHLEATAVCVRDEAGREVARWPYAEVRLIDEAAGARPVRLKQGETGAARLTVADRRILAALAARAPHLGRRRRRLGLGRGLGVAALGFAVFGAVVWVALPRLAEWTAARFPVSWEEALGERAWEQTRELLALIGDEPPRLCQAPAGQAALERLARRLAEAAGAPYRFRVVVLDLGIGNAFALPGGRIVVLRGLIDSADGAEEVAGVLAHEMGHVVRRHGTQALVRSLGLEVVFGLLLGDLGRGLFGGLGEVLLHLSYTREAEAEADAVALALLGRAGIRADGLAAFFERLAESGGEAPAALRLLATHPSHASRARLFAEAAGRGGAAMGAADWAALKGICGA